MKYLNVSKKLKQSVATYLDRAFSHGDTST